MFDECLWWRRGIKNQKSKNVQSSWFGCFWLVLPGTVSLDNILPSRSTPTKEKQRRRVRRCPNAPDAKTCTLVSLPLPPRLATMLLHAALILPLVALVLANGLIMSEGMHPPSIHPSKRSRDRRPHSHFPRTDSKHPPEDRVSCPRLECTVGRIVLSYKNGTSLGWIGKAFA